MSPMGCDHGLHKGLGLGSRNGVDPSASMQSCGCVLGELAGQARAGATMKGQCHLAAPGARATTGS